VGLSLSFSAAIWCKLSALALFPAILYVIFTAYEVKKFGLRIMLTLSWTMFSMFLIFPLLWQNFQYYGAFLPMSVGSGTPHNIDHIFNLKNIYLNLNFIFHSFYFPFENYWLGAFHLILFILLGIMSLFIFYNALRHYYRTISGFNDWHRKALIFLGLTLLFALIGLVYMIIRYHQAEARLTFLALPAITYLFLSGTDEVLGMYNRYLPKILAALIASSYLLFVIK
jgi:hypothetical protein